MLTKVTTHQEASQILESLKEVQLPECEDNQEFGWKTVGEKLSWIIEEFPQPGTVLSTLMTVDKVLNYLRWEWGSVEDSKTSLQKNLEKLGWDDLDGNLADPETAEYNQDDDTLRVYEDEFWSVYGLEISPEGALLVYLGMSESATGKIE